MITVACVLKSGGDYGAEYVRRLKEGVDRNLDGHRFVCLSDVAVPCERIPLKHDFPGWWAKLELFYLDGPVLFFDLDLVITDRLEPFFEYGAADDVILARNPAVPLERLGQTSLFRFPVGKLKPLQDAFRADPQGIADRYRYEQRFVTRKTPGGIKFWPKPWVRTFKQHCHRMLPINFFAEPILPKGARVVIFPGRVSPHDAMAGRWDSDDAGVSRREHIRRAFRGGRHQTSLRYLRHYYIPPRWLAEHWRE